MATRVQLSYEFIGRVMRSPKVRRELLRRAQRIRARAEAIDATEGGDTTFHVETGTRPQGRPYARVVSDNPESEFGTSKTARRRTLGRAAHS